jgi:hypothetical protein
MKEDRYRFLPHHDPEERTWAVLAPSAADLTLDTTVRHVSAMKEANEVLKEELHAVQKSKKRLQKQVDDLGTQLGQPPIYRKKAQKFTMVDAAP